MGKKSLKFLNYQKKKSCTENIAGFQVLILQPGQWADLGRICREAAKCDLTKRNWKFGKRILATMESIPSGQT